MPMNREIQMITEAMSPLMQSKLGSAFLEPLYIISKYSSRCHTQNWQYLCCKIVLNIWPNYDLSVA